MIPFDFFRHLYGYFTLLLYLSATVVSAFSCFFFFSFSWSNHLYPSIPPFLPTQSGNGLFLFFLVSEVTPRYDVTSEDLKLKPQMRAHFSFIWGSNSKSLYVSSHQITGETIFHLDIFLHQVNALSLWLHIV